MKIHTRDGKNNKENYLHIKKKKRRRKKKGTLG